MKILLVTIFFALASTACHATEDTLCRDSAQSMKEMLGKSQDPQARTIYMLAFGADAPDPLKIKSLVDSDEMNEAAAILASYDSRNRLEYLLDQGVGANIAVPGGAPLIVSATECRNLNAVKSLISHQANIYSADTQNVDAMAMAIVVDSEDIFELLKASGYRASSSTASGKLTIKFAETLHGGKYLKDLQQRGAEVVEWK